MPYELPPSFGNANPSEVSFYLPTSLGGSSFGTSSTVNFFGPEVETGLRNLVAVRNGPRPAFYRSRVLQWRLLNGKTAQQHRAQATADAELNAREIAALIQNLMNQGRLDPNMGRGLTEGLQYASTLAGLGGTVAGGWGALGGAIIGMGLGISDGILGTSRSDFGDHIEQVINLLLPIERFALWHGCRYLSDYVRRTEGKPPLGGFALVDRDNITIFGSRQILVAWMLEHLWHDECAFSVDGDPDPSTPFAELTPVQRYALGCAVTNQMDDSQKLVDEHLPRDTKDADPDTSDGFGGFIRQSWLTRWIRANNTVTAGDIRNGLENGPGPIMRDVTDQPWSDRLDAMYVAATRLRAQQAANPTG